MYLRSQAADCVKWTMHHLIRNIAPHEQQPGSYSPLQCETGNRLVCSGYCGMTLAAY